MQYKYLKITGDFIYGKQEISREDLVDVAQERVDVLINVDDSTAFDAAKNEWVELPGDK